MPQGHVFHSASFSRPVRHYVVPPRFQNKPQISATFVPAPFDVSCHNVCALSPVNQEIPLSSLNKEASDLIKEHVDEPLYNNQEIIRPKIDPAYDPTSNILSINSQRFHASLYEVPEDAILPDTTYTIQSIPSLPDGNKYMPIYTSIIVNPSTIWFNLIGETTSIALRKVMDKMEQLYLSNNGKKYTMRNEDVVISAVGASISKRDGIWYRICIVSVNMDSVRVFFIDSGNLENVPKSSLRYLKKEFMELPGQAIKARMAFLSPIHEKWDIRVTEGLLKLCQGKLVMAQVVDSPKYKDTISLFLCTYNMKEEVYVNMMLINDGYARLCESGLLEMFAAESCSLAQNCHLTLPSAANQLQPITEVMKDRNISSQFYDTVSPTASTNKIIISSAQNLNIGKPNSVVTQPYLLYDNSLVPVSSHSKYFSQEPSSQQDQHNLVSQSDTISSYYPLPLDLNAMETKNSCNSYSNTEASKMQQLATGPNYVRPTNPSQEVVTINDDDYSEIFCDGDNDDTFDEFGVQKYVQRVDLRFNYRIHIIALKGIAYVTAGDVTHLFWPTEAANSILNKLQQNNFSIPFKIIGKNNYPFLFQQLQRLEVKGLLAVEGKLTVSLFLLEHVAQILSIFGHPSPTIRYEIKKELNQFYASSDLWKVDV